MFRWNFGVVPHKVLLSILLISAITIFMASFSLGQTTIGEMCTHGQRQCQAGVVAECECEDAIVDSPRGGRERVIACVWRKTEEGCPSSRIPVCDKRYSGATHRFATGIKECKCWNTSSGKTECKWE